VGTLAAIFLLSAAAIADEIFLIRLLSFRFWPHFVPLIVSQAMLGLGASGVAIRLFRRILSGNPGRTFAWLVLLAAPSFDLCFRASLFIPFDPFLLLWGISAWLPFALFFLLLSVPFFLAGGAVGVPLSFGIGRIGPVYAASFAGTAAGAILALPSFHFIPTESLLRVPTALGFAAGACVLAFPDGRLRPSRASCLAVPALLLLVSPPSLSPSPYKDLATALKLPGARVIAVRSGPSADYRAVFAPALHIAPGLGFTYDGEIPPQAVVFADGEARGVVPASRKGVLPEYLRFFPAALPYHMVSRPAVLQLGLRGTEGILSAVLNGASSVTVVEPSEEYVRLVAEDLLPFSGGWAGSVPVEVRTEGGRNHLARKPGRFDIIELADISSGTFSSLGIHATGETYQATREGIRACLSHLGDNGVLAVSGWLKVPPRESVKILRTIRDELEAGGYAPAGNRVLMIRGWGSFAAVARKEPFAAQDVECARRFCDGMGFVVVWPQGGAGNLTTEPGERAVQDAVGWALAGKGGPPGKALFDLRPATDDSPYFHRFLAPGSIPEFRRLLGSQWAPFLEWGGGFLLLSLAVSLLLALIFLLLPPVFALQRNGEGGLPLVAYFSCLGVGYLLVELTFLKMGILVLGDTIRAATAAIGGFSLFSGIGSALSGRWESEKTMGRAIFPGIALLSIAGFLCLSAASPILLASGKLWQSSAFIASIAPAAFLMGIPFPAAISRLSRAGSESIPLAWGVNGFFSVCGASLASVGALWWGFRLTVLFGGFLYLLAGALFPRLVR
jgi:hypothetical protein